LAETSRFLSSILNKGIRDNPNKVIIKIVEYSKERKFSGIRLWILYTRVANGGWVLACEFKPD
jgi:hypothetical protein